MKNELTTISYALLGHLAMQDWTMYDLAAQMRRNVHYFFPKAESQIYAEPKRLVELGLASALTEMKGRRARTLYSITEKGRAELADWMAKPVSKGPLLEYEGLLRVFLAPFGAVGDLKSVIGRMRADNEGLMSLADRITDEYTQGRAPFQRHVQFRSFMHDFLFSFGELIDDWSERSLQRIERWEGMNEAEIDAEAVSVFRKRSRKVKGRVGRR
jgi:PadR family transcriptional regulator, regulatory protein AphA